MNVPDGWVWNKLGTICKIKKGVQFNRIELSDAGMYPCINGGITPSGYSDLWNTEAETITISEGGNSCGFVNYLTSKFWSGGHCYSLMDLKKGVDKGFLYQALKGRESLIMDLRVGSGLPNIQQKAVKEFKLLVPESDAEQRQIAHILAKVDEAISQTQQLIAKYRRLKAGLMQDLLTKGIDEKGNVRNEETHAFIEKDGFNYPMEWELTTVEKTTELIQQGWSPNCDSDPAPTNEWGVLKTTAVTWDGYDGNENKRVPTNLVPKRQYEVKNGDVLVTRAGPNSRVGVVSYVEHTRSKVIFSDKIYKVVPKKILLNRYLSLALSSEFTQRHLSNLKTGMAESQTNISQKIILALNILLPSTEEQEQIISTLDIADSSIKRISASIAKLQSLKTGLMQDLLSGKVRVEQLIRETADV